MGVLCYSTDYENHKSQKFFSDLTHIQTINNNNDLSEKIKLIVLINQANNSCTYDIKLYNIIGGKNHPLNEHSQCSISGNSSAKLNSPILIRYFFEKEQPLLIEILKTENGNTKKYEIRTTLGCIMGSRKNTFQKNISPSENEIIIIQGEKSKQNEELINLKLEVDSKHNINFKTPRNKIYYEIFSDNLLYRSEYIDEHGKFNPVKIPLSLFKNNLIKILFINITKNVIKEYKLNIDELRNEKIFNVNLNGRSIKIISKSKITKNYTFVDYLKAGIQIGLDVAIDFTGSNENPNDASSLHYIHGNIPSPYERAIFTCGNIVAYYDYDQLFPCFGFGAKINGELVQLFNLNLQQDPNINFIQGIIDAYHNVFNNIVLWGPTNFAPIIREINKIIKEQCHKLKYHILMILTDGLIDDLDETIDELVESSFLPLSVIIIGIGNADFSNMVYLDADENPLISSNGVKAARDIVQFVPFLKYESYPENLAIEVLEEIPRQIIDYYEQNNMDPIKLVH